MDNNPHWVSSRVGDSHDNITSWLTDPESLTQRLKLHNQHGFSVDLLNTDWVKPLSDEARLLGVTEQELIYQREVRLMDGDSANVYARTIVPRATYELMQHRLDKLGRKSLGELLFTDPLIKRGNIEIACLKPRQDLYEMAVKEESYRPKMLWGRRSPFYLDGKILIINEIFLPTLEW